MIHLPHLDCNITTVCNFRCAACSHASPFSEPYWMTVETMVRDLEMLNPFVHFEQLCLVGGEPTLHKDLLAFMDAGKASGIADKLCVVTNGSRLREMPMEFWETLEVLRLSIYARLQPDIYSHAEAMEDTYGFDLQAWEYPEFFKQLKSVPDDGVESFKHCEWRSDCYTVHEGHFYLCPQSAFFPPRFLGHESTDGLPLEGLTEEKLTAYLNRTEPFEACKICCAGEKKAFPWKESKNRTEWLKDSTL